jgi:hypothetical protein
VSSKYAVHLISAFTTASRPALGPAQTPIQRVPGALSLAVKRPELEAYHSPPSSVEVKNSWSCTSTPPVRLHGVVLSQSTGTSLLLLYLTSNFSGNKNWSYYILLLLLLLLLLLYTSDGKVKGKVVLCVNWAHHEGVFGEWTYSSTHSLNSALDGDEWSASHSGRFTPRKGATGTHWIGGWVGPRAVLNVVVKRKIPSPRWETNPRTPIVQPVAQRYTDWAITAPALQMGR